MSKAVIEQWTRDHLIDPLNRASAEIREQVEGALAKVPTNHEQVHAWFEEHMKKPPLSYETELLNYFHAAKDALVTRLKAIAGKAPPAPVEAKK